MRSTILILALSFAALLLSGHARQAHAQDLKILSLNVRVWTRDTDRDSPHYYRTRMEAMERMLRDQDPDIICLQEMMVPIGRYIPDGYRRIGISLRHPIYVRKGIRTSDYQHHTNWDSVLCDGLQIINIHSSWEKEVLERDVRGVNAALTDRAVACGDWNNRLPAIQKAGLQMQEAGEFVEKPEGDTFINFTNPSSHGVIDYFFLKGLRPTGYEMITDGYGCERISDHYPIVLTL